MLEGPLAIHASAKGWMGGWEGGTNSKMTVLYPGFYYIYFLSSEPLWFFEVANILKEYRICDGRPDIKHTHLFQTVNLLAMIFSNLPKIRCGSFSLCHVQKYLTFSQGTAFSCYSYRFQKKGGGGGKERRTWYLGPVSLSLCLIYHTGLL